jgi:hypothetical protein
MPREGELHDRTALELAGMERHVWGDDRVELRAHIERRTARMAAALARARFWAHSREQLKRAGVLEAKLTIRGATQVPPGGSHIGGGAGRASGRSVTPCPRPRVAGGGRRCAATRWSTTLLSIAPSASSWVVVARSASLGGVLVGSAVRLGRATTVAAVSAIAGLVSVRRATTRRYDYYSSSSPLVQRGRTRARRCVAAAITGRRRRRGGQRPPAVWLAAGGGVGVRGADGL